MDHHKFTATPYNVDDDTQMTLIQKSRAFDETTQEFPVSLGKEVSKNERDEKSLNKSSLIYGEVEFMSLAEIFEIIKSQFGEILPNSVFYDLGSGTGKGIVSAALLHNFKVCKGVEILRGLFEVSTRLKMSYEQFRLDALAQGTWGYLPDIELVNDDLFSVDWSDADFVFMNSTCFEQHMMNRIAQLEVKSGTWAVTLTKGLESPQWTILQSFRKPMSWGDATVYIHRRV